MSKYAYTSILHRNFLQWLPDELLTLICDPPNVTEWRDTDRVPDREPQVFVSCYDYLKLQIVLNVEEVVGRQTFHKIQDRSAQRQKLARMRVEIDRMMDAILNLLKTMETDDHNMLHNFLCEEHCSLKKYVWLPKIIGKDIPFNTDTYFYHVVLPLWSNDAMSNDTLCKKIENIPTYPHCVSSMRILDDLEETFRDWGWYLCDTVVAPYIMHPDMELDCICETTRKIRELNSFLKNIK